MAHMFTSKHILIIAGPNGAGKTTFANEFLPNEGDCPTFVNADLIAAELNPFQPERSAVEAGRLMLRMIDKYVRRGESFAFETTLSGRGYARLIPSWQAQGYWVRLCFLRLPTPDMAVARVRNRVIEGGHDVPPEVVRRRFHAGWRNFRQIYRDMVDEWVLHDTSEGFPKMVAEGGMTDKQNDEGRKDANKERPAHFIGAETALRRAAVKARKRAIETTGSVPTWRDGKIVYDTEV